MAMNVIPLRYGSNLSGMKKLILVIGALGLLEPGRTHPQVAEPIWVYGSAVAPFSGSRAASLQCDDTGATVILDVLIPGAFPAEWSALITKLDVFGQVLWADTLHDHMPIGHADMVLDDDDHILACAFGPGTIRVRKYSPLGLILWTTEIVHTGAQDMPLYIREGAGQVYVATTSYTDTTGRDLITRGLTDTGVLLWEQRYESGLPPYNEFLAGAAVDVVGRPYSSGLSVDTLVGSMLLQSLHLDGTPRWEARSYPSESAHGLVLERSGIDRMILLGMRPVPGGGGTDLVVHCYDTLGNQLWTQQLSIGDADSPRDLSIASDGTVFCIGTGTAADGSKDLGAFGISASGTLLWSHVVDDGPLEVLGSGIAAEAGGSCVLVGTRADPMQGGRSAIFTQRLDPSGQPLWSDLYTTPNEGHSGAHDVVVDPSGDILVHGQMRDTTISDEILVLKYAQETGLSEEGSTGSFMVAWPNPATDRVQVTYPGLHAGSRLRLTDTLGRVVAWGRSGMPHLELVALTPGLYDLACVDARGMVMARCPLVIGSH